MTESISNDPAALAEALGADYVIFVGEIGVDEILTGSAAQIVTEVQRLHREVEAIGDSDGAIDRTIIKLHDTLTPDSEKSLDSHQARHVLLAANVLIDLKQQHSEGAADEEIIRKLFDLYFVHQRVLTETSAGHYLRVLGDDLAIEIDFDFDKAWDIYQAALSAHERNY